MPGGYRARQRSESPALFETVAEVLGGAMKALEHYQKGREPAWQPTISRKGRA